MVAELLTPEASLIEGVTLQHRAHGAVLHEDAFAQDLVQAGRSGPARRVGVDADGCGSGHVLLSSSDDPRPGTVPPQPGRTDDGSPCCLKGPYQSDQPARLGQVETWS